MNWKDYEYEIHKYFKSQFPNADISNNVIVEGRYSKVSRQIDILIEGYVAGNRMKIIIDGKYFKKNINVKDVEMFIGMLNDCDVKKGLMITQKGYSKGAINRAYNDSIDLELDILNFENLYQFQGFGGIVYSGEHQVLLPSPFGWIIDATKRHGFIATLYQRGQTLELAQKNLEWMYVNIINKNNKIKDLNDILEEQQEYILTGKTGAKISFLPTIKRKDAISKIRVVEYESKPFKEYTGFIEFNNFVFLCILFTPDELSNKNIKKLEHIMSKATPLILRK